MSLRNGKTKFPCQCVKCGWKGQRVRSKSGVVTGKPCPRCKSSGSVETIERRPVKSSEGHGGARPHPPDREYGRPKNPYPLHLVQIQCTKEELQRILSQIPDTRQRAEALLSIADKAGN